MNEMNGKFQEQSNFPNILAKRAKREIRSTGETVIRCPKCNTMPEITTTPGGERTIVACECGYVHDVDINFQFDDAVREEYHMADVKAVANLLLHLAEKQAREEAGDLMTDLKLQKMLYFAQCWHLVRYNEPMFQNVIEAWDHGPVVPEIYSEYKQYGRNPIQASPVDYDAFSNQELETIMDVFAYYGRYSASGLREISHQYDSPWANAYKPGLKHLEITQESMKDFYKRQPPLETVGDRILRTAKEKGIEIIEPMISPNGNPVLPADD